MATLELKEHEWQEFSQAEYAVIDCYGQNCSACVMLAPIYDAVAISQAAVLGYDVSAFQIIPKLFYPFALLLSSLVFIYIIPERKK